MNQLAPIALFVYNRLDNTEKTVEALKINRLAKDSELFIFSDGPKDEVGRVKIQALRDYLKTIKGFKSITIREQETNKGLANSIIDGVTEIVNKYGKIIVLEDDLITSVAFLEYMNFCLDYFENDERVYSVNAYMFRVPKLPKYYFLKGGDCWGWATWARGWKHFNPDAQYLYNQIIQKNLINDWNYGKMKEIMQEAIKNPKKIWHIRWTTSIYLENKLGIWPALSYVRNIGTDEGTHTKGGGDRFNDHKEHELNTEVDRDFIQNMNVEEVPSVKKTVQDFYAQGKDVIKVITLERLIRRAKNFIKKIIKPVAQVTGTEEFLRKTYSKIK